MPDNHRRLKHAILAALPENGKGRRSSQVCAEACEAVYGEDFTYGQFALARTILRALCDNYVAECRETHSDAGTRYRYRRIRIHKEAP